ncbi:MAG: hypothetical protein K1060chlam1_00631 [Candidatus Anoxychlamydiales bacterium]|nr:hypothetical protein [Candidatus Anoxychlamydiales bacterium]
MRFKIYLYLSLISFCLLNKTNAIQFTPNDEKLISICKSYDIDVNKYQSHFDKTYFIKQNYNNFAILTIPKSGTHLLGKLLALATGRTKSEKYGCWFSPKYMQNIKEHNDEFILGHDLGFLTVSNIKFITSYRDFRDIIISWIHDVHWKKTKNWDIPKKDFQNILTQFLKDFKTKNLNNEYLQDMWFVLKVANFWQQTFKEKEKNSNVFFVKFEDIIGEKGGSSASVQQQTIKHLTNFLNISLSKNQLDYLCQVLHGKSVTFRKGIIGNWQDVFTQEHKKLFKELFNDFLVDFGYEKDDKW